MTKVYCINCKYFKDADEYHTEKCLENPHYYDTAVRYRVREFENPYQKNADNNCVGYAANLRKRISLFLGAKK